MANTNGLFALGAAAAWGGGDFSGGMGVRQSGGSLAGTLRFLILAHGISLVILAALVLPHGVHLFWGAATYWALGAGVAAALSITAFYIALSRGDMGVSAAISGILAAAIPAVLSSYLEGAPSGLRISGFVLAAAAIWAIAAGDTKASDPVTLWLAIAGGFGFGIYFISLRMANPLGVVMPMALARVASVTLCSVLVVLMKAFSKSSSVANRVSVFSTWPWAVGVALMDTGGNMMFVAATRFGRLDVAAVLASLYPASTILLAAWRLHEKPTRRQLGGMLLALVAVVMITV